MSIEHPELDRLAAVGKEWLTVDHFLDWLDEQGIYLAKYETRDDLVPIMRRKENLMYEFFGLNALTIETERRALLDYQRQQNKKASPC